MTSKPIAVLISDIHFTPVTLELAKVSFLRAQFKAKLLGVPLVVCGDTLDTKAVMRAECVNTLLELVSVKDSPNIIFIVGNHELVNERGNQHTLHFLKPYATVIDRPQVGELSGVDCMLIPYMSNPEQSSILSDKEFPPPKLIIMHQGLKSANSGEYGDHDKSAITYEDVKDFRVISGHYHARQDIKTGRPRKGGVGMFSYIGNPYTLTFGEAGDPPKGFQVLYDDGSLEFIPTNLRKHVVFNMACSDIDPQTILVHNTEDLLWLKITGTKEELAKLDRQSVIARMNANAAQIRIDFIPQKVNTNVDDSTAANSSGQMADALDNLIDRHTASSDMQKSRIKQLWRAKS